MIIKKGFLEILQMADSSEPRNFDDFTKITITRKLSSATVAKRLQELVRARALEEVVTQSKTGRRTVGYRTTDKGKKVIEMARELEVAITMTRTA